MDRISAKDLIQPQVEKHLAHDQPHQALVAHQTAAKQREEDSRAERDTHVRLRQKRENHIPVSQGAGLSVRQERSNRRGALLFSEVHRTLSQNMPAHGYRESLSRNIQKSGLSHHTSANRV